jgi:DNA repair protein RecN (Recombination protein N)
MGYDGEVGYSINPSGAERNLIGMLVQLTISNFAIISRLDISFKPGLNILSGETGAGKSIIINAVNLILGGRASADLIRSGSNEARVEALFSLPEHPFFSELLSDLGLTFQGELLIRRTLSREGRNKIMINDSMVTLQTLSKIGATLISISGQHEHQLLLRPDNHLYLLDDFGGLTPERLELNDAFRQYQSLEEALQRLERGIKEDEERQELTRFQMKEIETAHIKEGEDTFLEEERKRLRHAEELRESVGESYERLYEKGDSVLSDLSHCIKRMEKGAEVDRRLSGIRDALVKAKVELEETALELRDLRKTITADPARLEEVEERLQLLNRLKRKYGPSLEDVSRLRDKLSHRVDNLDQKKAELEKTRGTLKDKERDIMEKATHLSKKRKRVAQTLEKSVKSEMGLLDMGGTRFEVRFYTQGAVGEKDPESAMGAINADGQDKVEFMLSPNVGEELRPLSRIASGGELSRIMLAMKTILARTASVETLVFDEVDSGIGGATAEVVGDKLQSLAAYHQILCITHLPQIASKGRTHFLVQKRVKDKRTQTIISELDARARVKEIARLLAGKVVSPEALAHAKEMMRDL